MFWTGLILVMFGGDDVLVVGMKNPPPSRLIGVGRDPKSGSFGKVCFGGMKLSLRLFPLAPKIATRT